MMVNMNRRFGRLEWWLPLSVALVLARCGGNADSGGAHDGGGASRAGSEGGTAGRGAGGGSAGGSGGGVTGGSGGSTAGGVIFFDDFLAGSIDTSKWTVIDRLSDQANGEISCDLAANVSVSGGLLKGLAKFEDHTCGDSNQAPVLEHYAGWHIQQASKPFLYGTIEVRAKLPGGTGIWPSIWMLGFKWQASQAATANVVGHNWPHEGWCEIDIAEFWQNARTTVNNTVHFEVAGGLHLQSLPFDATTRFMVYRLEWQPGSLIWSVDGEDGVGYRTLRTVTGASSVPNVPMYLVFNSAIGGSGGGTPVPSTFPQTFSIDWVRVTQ
jgi:beta-glucanase (GH16 family)